MKKNIILLTILVLVGLLVACGGTDTAGDNQPSDIQVGNMDQAETASKDFASELPLQTALIVGTFNLESTEYEVTAEQAAELLPLWQVLKTLLESDTAAAEEIGALVNQIAGTMTSNQMEQIYNMALTQESIRVLNQELGLSESFQRPDTDEEHAESGAERPEGAGQGMGPGGGQGSGAGAAGLSPEEMEVLQATREAGGGGFGRGMANTELVDALIELLQSK